MESRDYSAGSLVMVVVGGGLFVLLHGEGEGGQDGCAHVREPGIALNVNTIRMSTISVGLLSAVALLDSS